ncbi:MAG: NUDIX domain-containing protein [Desulfuromonadaceae bacterium]|nr:NUDIX domain-containing protein [Desulfuromonadaceae bacterium]
MQHTIGLLESKIPDPTIGLPEDIFLFISRVTPLVNVDLLIKNEKNQTLLTWRVDNYTPAGWHVPGGIIRYKETTAERLRRVAQFEFGACVTFDPIPLVVNEFIEAHRKDRGHFISLLYRCNLISALDETLRCTDSHPQARQWKWHSQCPENLIPPHHIYKKFI